MNSIEIYKTLCKDFDIKNSFDDDFVGLKNIKQKLKNINTPDIVKQATYNTYKYGMYRNFHNEHEAWYDPFLNYLIKEYPELFWLINYINEKNPLLRFYLIIEYKYENYIENFLSKEKIDYLKINVEFNNTKYNIYVYNIYIDEELSLKANKDKKFRNSFEIARKKGYKIIYYLSDTLLIPYGFYWNEYIQTQIKYSRTFNLFCVKKTPINTKQNTIIYEDLKRGFRSSYESNFARVLSYLNIEWEYEKQFYEVETKTNFAYLPDFELKNGNLVEVKGFWDFRSILNINNFIEKYPNKNLITIDTDIILLLQEKYSDLINNWEYIKPINNPIDINIVGINYPDRIKYSKKIQINDKLKLIRDKDNQYDKNAIKAVDINNNFIGFVNKKIATILSRNMDYGFNYTIKVININEKYFNCKICETNNENVNLEKIILDLKLNNKLK